MGEYAVYELSDSKYQVCDSEWNEPLIFTEVARLKGSLYDFTPPM